MKNKNELESISKLPDDELLRRLSELLQKSRRVESELVAHIGEVDRRRLYAERVSSMFKYATEILHLSEYEAYLRIEVARATRKHPVLLEMLADGRLHLSGIKVLVPHLTEANREALLKRAAYQSKRKIEELVAEVSPKPDVASSIRKLPERRDRAKSEGKSEPGRDELGPDLVALPTPSSEQNLPEGKKTVANPEAPAPAKPSEMRPLAPGRYKVSFTASAELRDKLERLRGLMRSSVPDGDLATLIELAVTEKIEKLESKRYGKTKSPRKSLEETDTSASSRTVPAPVKRAVYTRDQGRCRFEDVSGRRCAETERLEFHHLQPYGRGGDHSPDNIQLRCRTHNLYQAELDYGEKLIERYRSSPCRVSEPAALYTSGTQATPVGNEPLAVRSAA